MKKFEYKWFDFSENEKEVTFLECDSEGKEIAKIRETYRDEIYKLQEKIEDLQEKIEDLQENNERLKYELKNCCSDCAYR